MCAGCCCLSLHCDEGAPVHALPGFGVTEMLGMARGRCKLHLGEGFCAAQNRGNGRGTSCVKVADWQQERTFRRRLYTAPCSTAACTNVLYPLDKCLSHLHAWTCHTCRDLELLKLQMLEKAEAPFRAKCDLLARVRVSSSRGGGGRDALEVLIMHMLPDNASKKTGVGSADGFHWLALQTLLWG